MNNSRRDPAPSGKPPKEPKEKSRHPLLRFLGRILAMLICLGIMAGSLLVGQIISGIVGALLLRALWKIWKFE